MIKKSKELKLNLYNRILCPECGGDYLHQGRVEVFEKEEGDPDCTHVTVYKDLVNIDRSNIDNPSDRRYSTRIYFFCESCHDTSVLDIYQDRGQTVIEWGSTTLKVDPLSIFG